MNGTHAFVWGIVTGLLVVAVIYRVNAVHNVVGGVTDSAFNVLQKPAQA